MKQVRPEAGLRWLNEPRPIQVVADAEGVPTAVAVRGGTLAVAEIADRWCIEEEWWRAPISRRYYRLLLDDGRHLTVFPDQVAGRWYAQRYPQRSTSPLSLRPTSATRAGRRP
jgi:hypothetical protein